MGKWIEQAMTKAMGEPEKLFALFQTLEKIQLLLEVLPRIEIKPLKIGEKEYIAILFERPKK